MDLIGIDLQAASGEGSRDLRLAAVYTALLTQRPDVEREIEQTAEAETRIDVVLNDVESKVVRSAESPNHQEQKSRHFERRMLHQDQGEYARAAPLYE